MVPRQINPPTETAEVERTLLEHGLSATLDLKWSVWLGEKEERLDPLLLWRVRPDHGVRLPQVGPRWQEDNGLHVTLIWASDLEKSAVLRADAQSVATELRRWSGVVTFARFSHGHVGFLGGRNGTLLSRAAEALLAARAVQPHISF